MVTASKKFDAIMQEDIYLLEITTDGKIYHLEGNMKSNYLETEVDDIRRGYSYGKLIAVSSVHGDYIDPRYIGYSSTTTRHIKKFFGERYVSGIERLIDKGAIEVKELDDWQE